MPHGLARPCASRVWGRSAGPDRPPASRSSNAAESAWLNGGEPAWRGWPFMTTDRFFGPAQVLPFARKYVPAEAAEVVDLDDVGMVAAAADRSRLRRRTCATSRPNPPFLMPQAFDYETRRKPPRRPGATAVEHLQAHAPRPKCVRTMKSQAIAFRPGAPPPTPQNAANAGKRPGFDRSHRCPDGLPLEEPRSRPFSGSSSGSSAPRAWGGPRLGRDLSMPAET